MDDDRRRLASDFVDSILEGPPMPGKTGPRLVPPDPGPPPSPAQNNAAYWSGLVVAALVAATAHLGGSDEPLQWRDWIELASVVAIGINGYLIRR